TLHAAGPMPADDRGWDLIANAVGEDAGGIPARPSRSAHRLARLLPRLPAIEETEVLTPGHVQENTHPLDISPLQEPGRRKVVGTHSIDAGRLHPLEIILDARRRRERLAVLVDDKGAVSYALQAHSFLAVSEVFSVDPQSSVDREKAALIAGRPR